MVNDPLRHHGDADVAPGLLDLAVNVFPDSPPTWLIGALHDAVDQLGAYPSAKSAESAVAARHSRHTDQVLATAGAAEAFTLISQMHPWRRPVVVHPQFTEPHDALLKAGHHVTSVCLPEPFILDASAVPDEADLVVIGNPTNPTGVLHQRGALVSLLRPGRTLVVDEAFLDLLPGEPESLASLHAPGLIVVRSLTKLWGIPGVRAGYLLGDEEDITVMRRLQVPWSVSTHAAVALTATASEAAAAEAATRGRQVAEWRNELTSGLDVLGVHHIGSQAAFVLARPGVGARNRLREAGIAVRRCDTFPGLDDSWIRIAVRPPEITTQLIEAMRKL